MIRLRALAVVVLSVLPACGSRAASVPPAEHAPGVCALCDAYTGARRFVVRVRAESGAGTGIVVDRSGLLVTNAHVVGVAEVVEIETHAGDFLIGHVLRRDVTEDLALIRAEAPWLVWTPAPLASEALPPVGSEVSAIGHPVGLGWTITRGILSGYRRAGEIGPVDLLQTDAAISPGNSGGPLLDDAGRVVGIVTSKMAGAGAENLAFARPVAALHAFLAGEAGRLPPSSAPNCPESQEP